MLAMASFLALGLGNCGRRTEPLSSGDTVRYPHWARQQGFENNAKAVRGAMIFAQVGCLTCHTYLGAGTRNMGAPDLSEIGKTGRSAEQYAAYIGDPSKFGNQVMPRFQDLGERNLLALGEFLRVSRGER